MIQKLQSILKEYNAHVLAYPSIGNTPMMRDEFISDGGNIYYSDLKTGLNEIEFTIEFKGSDYEIKENRWQVSKMLEYATITFDEEVFYKGRFIESGYEKRYYFETVTYTGTAIAHLYTQSYKVKRNEVTKVYNNGNLKTPARVILKGQGTDIKVTGFESTINIKSLEDEIIIDAEKGISDDKGVNNVSLFAFPYIDQYAEIRVYGTGSFKCYVEFEGRVIC